MAESQLPLHTRRAHMTDSSAVRASRLVGALWLFERFIYSLNPTLAPAAKVGAPNVVVVQTPRVTGPSRRYWAAAPTVHPPYVEAPTSACTDHRPSEGPDVEVVAPLSCFIVVPTAVAVVSDPWLWLPAFVTVVVTVDGVNVPGT